MNLNNQKQKLIFSVHLKKWLPLNMETTNHLYKVLRIQTPILKSPLQRDNPPHPSPLKTSIMIENPLHKSSGISIPRTCSNISMISILIKPNLNSIPNLPPQSFKPIPQNFRGIKVLSKMWLHVRLRKRTGNKKALKCSILPRTWQMGTWYR